MATTGAELSNYFDLKIDKAYSAYFDPAKKNRLFKSTLTFMAAKLRKGLVSGTQYDELTQLIKTNQVFSLNNNQIATAPILISTLTYTAAVNATMTATTYLPHNLVTGDSITVSGAVGITTNPVLAYNGTFTVTVTGAKTFTYVITNNPAPSGTYTSGSGSFTTANMISDYAAHLASKVRFLVANAVSITGVTATAVMKVTAVNHNLRDGETIVISGVTGTVPLTTNINASHTVTVLSKDTFTVAASGVGGAYTSGGTISQEYYEFTKPWRSDQKIGEYGQPTVSMPKVEWTEKMIRFYPLTVTATHASIDYIAVPAIEIDVSNSTTDLEKYFSREFLLNDFLKEVVAQGELAARDYAAYQAQVNDIIQNP